jgi:hypothetical protein
MWNVCLGLSREIYVLGRLGMIVIEENLENWWYRDLIARERCGIASGWNN